MAGKPTLRYYGINIATMAGMPGDLISEALEIRHRCGGIIENSQAFLSKLTTNSI
tara:strand:+ start:6762 stop:6926 length:165 start_codon:yes stop_codon:yes gene_type:complete